MTTELQDTLAAVGIALFVMVGFASVVGLIVLAAWGVAWLRAWWSRVRGSD